MKNRIKKISIVLSVLVAANVSAKVSTKKYHAVAKEIVALENAHNYVGAALKSANAANELASVLGVDSVVKSIETVFRENRQEVIVGHVDYKFSDSGSIDGSAAGAFAFSGSGYYDMTKILTTNAEEVSLFNQKQKKDFKNLQQSLAQYVTENEEAIVLAKTFVAKSLILAEKAPLENVVSIYPYLTKTALKLSSIRFEGEQSIQNCLSMNYADTKSESTFVSQILNFSFSEHKVVKNFAHKETSCTVSTDEASVNSMDNLISIDLIIDNASQRLSLKLLKETMAPMFPTWGSSYY